MATCLRGWQQEAEGFLLSAHPRCQWQASLSLGWCGELPPHSTSQGCGGRPPPVPCNIQQGA